MRGPKSGDDAVLPLDDFQRRLGVAFATRTEQGDRYSRGAFILGGPSICVASIPKHSHPTPGIALREPWLRSREDVFWPSSDPGVATFTRACKCIRVDQ